MRAPGKSTDNSLFEIFGALFVSEKRFEKEIGSLKRSNSD
jgi:hypothetical protein